MITASQILAHLLGDYLLQSDWQANEKTKRLWIALSHALLYAVPFLTFRPSPFALVVIVVSHALIDRFRLTRYLIYAKNLLAPAAYRYPWADCQGTGYHKDRPAWLAVWLMIIADNTLHILVNGLALALL